MYVDANAPQRDVDVQVGARRGVRVGGAPDLRQGMELVGGCWDVTCRVMRERVVARLRSVLSRVGTGEKVVGV